MEHITYKTIGIINTPHQETEKTPVQPVYSKGIKGTVLIYPEYAEGLKDLEGFSHIYLLYHFHKVEKCKLIVKPFLQDVERGIFSIRAPYRPNPIGISIVRLMEKQDNVLHIEDVDILDGTPLIDIKPYTAKFDLMENIRSGWQDEVSLQTAEIRGKRDYKE